MTFMDRFSSFLMKLAFQVAPRLATRVMVWKFANSTQPRPRRWSMAHAFVSWTGLVDRTYSGRHLPEDLDWDERVENGAWDREESRRGKAFGPRLDPAAPADNDKLRQLFLRQGRQQQDCTRSSVLFLFFAQWFTDAFLRTNPDDHARTDSNHEIDFCAIYGLTEEKTHMLRVHLTDEQGRVQRDETGKPLLDPDKKHLLATDETGMFPPRLYDVVTIKGVETTRFRDSYRYDEKVVEEGDLEDPASTQDGVRRRYLHEPKRMESITKGQNTEQKAKYFAMGLEHGNGTLGYVVLNTLMLRAHNTIAQDILDAHGAEWGDEAGERAFQSARNVLTFILLKIVIEDYVAHISGLPLKTPVGVADGAKWGKSNRIALEFNLLYRWHSMVPDQLHVKGKPLGKNEFRRMPALVEEYGLETLLTEFSRQKAGRIGLRNYPDFFGEPHGQDEMNTLKRTLSIAHDAKFQSMNTYRRHFGLLPIFSFRQLVGNQPEADVLYRNLREIYGSIHDVEWFVGMVAEDHTGSVIMGELMRNMVAYDAFTQALTNPLLSKRMFDRKLGGPEPVFSKKGLALMDQMSTLQDVSDYVLGEGTARCSFSA
ncbi:MAG: peroxidase family protein [Pseudomonadota bacterium]